MVSVIVCTYNRAKYLPACLKHLAEQSVDYTNYEVLIVDNNSTDNTAEICHDFIAENESLNFYYFLENNQGHTFARNRGILEAGGEILSFIDDDAFVKNDFIENIGQYFNSHKPIMAIGGKIIPVYETEKPKWMSKYLLTLVSAIDLGDKPKAFKGNKFPIGANMAFRKEVFNKYGLFNTELGRRADGLEGGDEKEVFLRLKDNNEVIHYVPSVCVDHIIPEKRIQIPYIKGLGIGVGSSEIKRLKGAGFNKWMNKIISEFIKFVATFILFIGYCLQLKFNAALMLVKFRIWVIKGMIQKQHPTTI